MDMSNAPALPRNFGVVASYERRGYQRVRETGLGVVLRHPNGGMITVLVNGEIRGGDKAGARAFVPDDAWEEPTYYPPPA